ncbi:MAG: hypothetical protein M1396_05030 [Chloroflexi bacterium]|nr:hypothetical protein [Chloroflexota bacterium]
MSAPESPTPPTEPWPPGSKDTLPPNIPPAASTAISTSPLSPRKSGRGKLTGLIVITIVVPLIVGIALGVVLDAKVIAPHFNKQTTLIHTLSNIGGNPLFSAHVNGEPLIPPAPFKFLEAQAQDNGQAMWNELSPSEQQALAAQGGSPQQLTALLKKQGKIDVRQITFAGGAMLNDGREACIFIVTADVNGALRQAPYYFTVDTNGKIDEFH